MTVKKFNGKCITSSFEKPTNKHIYTSPSSDAPKNWKFSWITGENIRLLRNNSLKEEFETDIYVFKQRLLLRKYPLSIINKYIKYTFEDRNVFLTASLNQFRKSNIHDWFIFIQNMPGRDLLIKSLNDFVSAIKEILFFDDMPRVIVKKGTTILDFCNKANRSVLLQHCNSVSSNIEEEIIKNQPLDFINNTVASNSNAVTELIPIKRLKISLSKDCQ